jgi:hypothetical protein
MANFAGQNCCFFDADGIGVYKKTEAGFHRPPLILQIGERAYCIFTSFTVSMR